MAHRSPRQSRPQREPAGPKRPVDSVRKAKRVIQRRTIYLLLLFGLVLWCLRAIGRTKLSANHRARVLPAALFAGMAGVLAHCFFENIFEVPYMMAYFWSMAAAILYSGYFRKRRAAHSRER